MLVHKVKYVLWAADYQRCLHFYRDLFGGDPDVVISGFHMMKKQPYDCEELDVIDETARELARHNTVFYTGHCTGLPAFERMQTILGEQLRPLHSGVELDLATR